MISYRWCWCAQNKLFEGRFGVISTVTATNKTVAKPTCQAKRPLAADRATCGWVLHILWRYRDGYHWEKSNPFNNAQIFICFTHANACPPKNYFLKFKTLHIYFIHTRQYLPDAVDNGPHENTASFAMIGSWFYVINGSNAFLLIAQFSALSPVSAGPIWR